jgi:hypothetical protein
LRAGECWSLLTVYLFLGNIYKKEQTAIMSINPYSPDGIKNKLSKSWFDPVKIGII